jgi:hypothetical protein
MNLAPFISLGVVILFVIVGSIVGVRSRSRSVKTPPVTPRSPVAVTASSLQPEIIPAEPSSRQLTVRKWQSREGHATGEFVVLEPGDLREVAVVAQALDNQWVQRSFLAEMQKHGWNIQSPQVVAHQLRFARAEYIRALVNAEQVIINRAFLYNSAVVTRDYTGHAGHAAEHRKAFLDLLGDGIIAPYLFDEQSPADRPVYEINEPAFAEWVKLCQDVQTHCVRLSWDEGENKEGIATMSSLLDEWAAKASRGDSAAYADALGIPDGEKGAFHDRLVELGVATLHRPPEKKLTRNDVYKEFVLVDGSNPIDGIIDPQKPFAAQIRQLADLRYNTNLPDMLGRYALTPIDSLPRTALQELKILGAEQQQRFDEQSIVEMLRRTAFDIVQGGAFLQGMEQMELDDVQAARGTDEWLAYIQSMRALLAEPLAFQERAGVVYQHYVKLMERMTDLIRQRRGTVLTERWMPIISLVINIGSAIITTHFGSPIPGFGGNLAYTLSTNAAQSGATRIIGRLIIQGAARAGTQARLETSIDFLKGRVRDGKSLWDEMVGKTLPEAGFKKLEDPAAVRELEDSAVINYAESPQAEIGG